MALPGAIGPPRVEFTPVLLTVRADEGVRYKWFPHMEATHAAELALLDGLCIARLVLYLQATDNSSGSPSGRIVSFHHREGGRCHGTDLVLQTICTTGVAMRVSATANIAQLNV